MEWYGIYRFDGADRLTLVFGHGAGRRPSRFAAGDGADLFSLRRSAPPRDSAPAEGGARAVAGGPAAPAADPPPMHVSGGAPAHPAAGGGKTVHVSGYTRKDGTVVRPHDRAAPGMGGGKKR